MKRLDLILEKLDSVEKKVDSLELKVDSLEHRMDSMEHRMDSMEDKMNDEFFRLNLRLENEVFFGIKAVADGHADIMRKYKHLLDDRYDKEQILVRLVHHESKIHEIERNCKHCA